MARYRSYSDSDRAAALLALDGGGANLSEIARATGIPRSTLQSWDEGHVAPEITKFRREKRQCLADRLESLAHQCLDQIPTRLEGGTLRDLVAALAVCIDKMLLLRELPTVITREDGMAAMSDEQRAEHITELLARVRANGKAPPDVH